MTCINFQKLDFTHLAPEYVEPYSTPHIHGDDRQYIGEAEFLRLFNVHANPTVLEGMCDMIKIFRGKPLTALFSLEDLTTKLVESDMAPDKQTATQLVPLVLQKRFCEPDHYGHYHIEEKRCQDGNTKYFFHHNLDIIILK